MFPFCFPVQLCHSFAPELDNKKQRHQTLITMQFQSPLSGDRNRGDNNQQSRVYKQDLIINGVGSAGSFFLPRDDFDGHLTFVYIAKEKGFRVKWFERMVLSVSDFSWHVVLVNINVLEKHVQTAFILSQRVAGDPEEKNCILCECLG